MKIFQKMHIRSPKTLLFVGLYVISGCQSTPSEPDTSGGPNNDRAAVELQTGVNRPPSGGRAGDTATVPASPRTSYQEDRVALERREKEEIERKRQREKLETVGEGVGAVAVLGTAIGLLVPDGGRIKSAAIGASTGAVAGSIAGNYVASKQEEFGDELDVLDSMIADVRAAQVRIKSDILLNDRIIAEQRSQLQQLNSDLAAKRIARQRYENRIAQLKEDRAKAKVIASSSRAELAKFQGAGKYYRKGKPAQRGKLPLDNRQLEARASSYDDEVKLMSVLLDELDGKVAQLGKLALRQ